MYFSSSSENNMFRFLVEISDSILLSVQEWLVNEKELDVFGMKLPTGFQLIGQVVCSPLFFSHGFASAKLFEYTFPYCTVSTNTRNDYFHLVHYCARQGVSNSKQQWMILEFWSFKCVNSVLYKQTRCFFCYLFISRIYILKSCSPSRNSQGNRQHEAQNIFTLKIDDWILYIYFNICTEILI